MKTFRYGLENLKFGKVDVSRYSSAGERFVSLIFG